MKPREKQACFSPSQKVSETKNTRKTMSCSDVEKDPNQTLFDTLMSDPIKRDLVMKMIHLEKDNIEAYKKREQEREKNNKTPVGKIRNKHYMESPTELSKRLYLERQRRELSSPASSSSGSVPSPPPKVVPIELVLKGVVAYVEIMANHVNKSSGCKTLLENMGATVKDRFSSDVTHVIYKDGLFSTYQKAKLIKAHLVSVLWVEEVRITSSRVPEKKFPAMGVDYDVSEKICEDFENEFRSVAGSSQNIRRKTTFQGDLKALRDFSQNGVRNKSIGSDDFVANSQDLEVASIISSKHSTSSSKQSIAPAFISDSDSEFSAINDTLFTTIINTSTLNSSNDSGKKKTPKNKIKIDTSSTSSNKNSISSNDSIKLINPRRKTIRNTSTSSLDLIQITPNTRTRRQTLAIPKNIGAATPEVDSFKENSIESINTQSNVEIASKNLQITTKTRSKRKTLAASKKFDAETPDDDSSKDNSSDSINTQSNVKNAPKNLQITTKTRPKRKTLAVSKNFDDSSKENSIDSINTPSNVENASKDLQITTKTGSKRKTLSKKIDAETPDDDSTKDNSSDSNTPKKNLISVKMTSISDNSSNLKNTHRKTVKDPLIRGLDLFKVKLVPTIRTRRNTLAIPEILQDITPEKVNVPKFSQSERKNKKLYADDAQNCTNCDLVDMELSGCKNARVSIESTSSNASEDVGCYVTKRRPRRSVRNLVQPQFETDSDGFKLPIKRCSKESALTCEMSSLRLSTDTYVSSKKNSMEFIDDLSSLRISASGDDLKNVGGNSKQLMQDSNKSSEEMSSLRLSLESDGKNGEKRKSDVSSECEVDTKRTKKIVNRRSMRQKSTQIDSSSNSDEQPTPDAIKTITKISKIAKAIKATKINKDDATSSSSSDNSRKINKDDATSSSSSDNSRKINKDDATSSSSSDNLQKINKDDSTSSSSSDNSRKINKNDATSNNSRKIAGGRRKLYNPDESFDDSSILFALEQEKLEIIKNKKLANPTPDTHIIPIILTHKAMEIINKRAQLTDPSSDDTDMDDTNINNAISDAKINKKSVKIAKKVHDPDEAYQKELHEEFVYKKPVRKSMRVASQSQMDDPIIPILNRRSTMDFVPPTEMPKRSQKSQKTLTRKRTIVCTRFHREDVLVFQQIVKKLGGFNVENDVSLRTTHLVSYEPKRTVNILKAIARGLWVLKPDWIYQSLEKGKWLPEEDFEMVEFSAAIQQCRLERQSFGPLYSMDLFEDCGLIYIARSTNPTYTDLEELVQLGKGVCTKLARNAAIVVGEALRYPDIVYVKESWILDSITLNKCKNVRNYLLPSLLVQNNRQSDHF